MRCALYGRVSTNQGQTTANQVRELEAYIGARGWTIVGAYLDEGVSGAKESRPALDRLLRDAKRRRFDAVVCGSLDRMGRSLKHLITLLDEFQALGIAFVSLREGLDWSTPAGRLQAQLLAMISEFERLRIAERVRSGMARAKAQGKNVGRPRVGVTEAALASMQQLSVREAAARLGVSKSFVARWRASQRVPETPPK